MYCTCGLKEGDMPKLKVGHLLLLFCILFKLQNLIMQRHDSYIHLQSGYALGVTSIQINVICIYL